MLLCQGERQHGDFSVNGQIGYRVLGYTDRIFKDWTMRLMLSGQYRIRRTEYKKIYVHQLHIRRESGEYVHVFYQNFRETAGGLYTLRLETRPENYGLFLDVMKQLRNVASEINFESCDVAYDVP